MSRWLGPVLVLLACAAGVHALTLNVAPGFIMARAMDALAQRGVTLHDFTAPRRISPQTQAVVRSSPDLYYALCRYDLGQNGVDQAAEQRLAVAMAKWGDYQSLSFFDARTNNFATVRGTGKAVAVNLLPPGSAPQKGAIVSPSAKGVILIRRLAPTRELFDQAAASVGDECRFLAESGPQTGLSR
ncbi:DUF1254 domain-containing protein [Erythrobacter sp.]|uniref:DUF1254 domain-containing protein n=1 Tax=Erythrobacter sp. TaxID=1042 RepID=UPI0025EACE59|nr:DUF1254 domain-containing protein [Erythrobacter sp.]